MSYPEKSEATLGRWLAHRSPQNKEQKIRWRPPRPRHAYCCFFWIAIHWRAKMLRNTLLSNDILMVPRFNCDELIFHTQHERRMKQSISSLSGVTLSNNRSRSHRFAQDSPEIHLGDDRPSRMRLPQGRSYFCSDTRKFHHFKSLTQTFNKHSDSEFESLQSSQQGCP